jgi:hypothetical protein
MSDGDDLYVTDALEVDGTTYLGNQVRIGNSPFENSTFYFRDDPGDQFFRWAWAFNRFEFTNSVLSTGTLIANNDIWMAYVGPDLDQSLQFWEGGEANERIQWDDSADRFEVSDDFAVFGELTATTKNFVQNHPYRDDLEVVYTSLEGDEATTFTRGLGRLEGGEARIPLGETFALVTNPDIGLSAHLTPFEDSAGLYVASLTTDELVVREVNGGTSEASFSYIVYGLRIGFEDFPVLRKKMAEAFVPPQGHYDRYYQAEPELRAYTALERYRRMFAADGGSDELDLPGARALRQAIGEHDPAFDYPVGSTVPVAHMDRRATDDEDAIEPPPESDLDRVAGAAVAPGSVTPGPQRDDGNFYAGYQPMSEPVEIGDVVSVDPIRPGFLKRSSHEADTAVVGIVSGKTGFADIGRNAATPSDPHRAPVALSGIVLCNVDAAVNPIAVGDLLTTSPIPGHAMRADDPAPGTILGKALEVLETGTGQIRVLVMQR